jgi:nucleoside-diphosphate-sugar epimerase
MKAFVAGGTGFIGSHIVEHLILRNIHVKALIRNSSNTARLRNREVEFVNGDVLDPSSLKKHLEGVDLVFSAFGILGQWGIPDKTYHDINARGVRILLESCLDSNIKQFIHVSSAGVLGPLPEGVVADESFPFNPSNIYESSKCEAEKEVISYGRKGIPFTIIRPEFVYGPGDTHVLGLFKAIKAGRFVFLGNGERLLHPTYIDDLIQGVNLCTDNRNAIGKIFLITGEKPITVRELANIIADELGVHLTKIKIPLFFANTIAKAMEAVAKTAGFEPMLTRSRVKFFTENRAFSYQKARTEIGYVPAVNFREGVRRTIEWYQENRYL